MTTAFNRSKACRFGSMLYNVNDKYVGRSLDLYGEFSYGESDVFRQLVRPGDVVIDVGANIGAHTLQLAQLAGPEGVVFAFEPQRLIFQTLCANMALNSITNAHCFQRAVGHAPGTIVVPVADPYRTTNFGGIALGNWKQGERVPVTTIDALDLPACRLIKVDVEGMELDVLHGAHETIRRTLPYLYVENDRPAGSDGLVREIAALGYDSYWHKPPLFNPDNFAGDAENVFERLVSINILAVPRRLGVTIEGVPRIEVPDQPGEPA